MVGFAGLDWENVFKCLVKAREHRETQALVKRPQAAPITGHFESKFHNFHFSFNEIGGKWSKCTNLAEKTTF